MKETENIKISKDSTNFVFLTDYVKDAILEIRYFSGYNFVGKRIDGYEEPYALITKEAAVALKKISDDLKQYGYTIKIYDAYRPYRSVQHFIKWAEDLNDKSMKQYFYPNIDKSKLFEYNYLSKTSSHSRGSTVDLTLFDKKTGKELDMGGVFDYFGDISSPDYENISKEQYENRMILRNIMIKNGFVPSKSEWWHFTLEEEPYKDTYFDFTINSNNIKNN